MTVKQTTASCSAYEQCSLTDEELINIKTSCNDEMTCSITSIVPDSCLFNNYGHLNISYSCKEKLDNSCNFENGKCGWSVIGQYTYRWEIGTGLTKTRRTGPNGDHTTSFGHYIYTESRGNSSLNDESNLLSGWIVPSPKQCMSFWYHMYGSNINKLVVFQMNRSHNIDIWNISNDQGNKWHFKSLTLKNIGQYQIMFKAIRGTDRTSDIAIDDIVIYNNACNGTINYSQTCLKMDESISLQECSKYNLQLNNLVFDKKYDNCSIYYQNAKGLSKTLCDDVDNADICTFNLSEVIKKRPACFQSNRLLVEYTCEERVPNILSDDSQKTNVSLDNGKTTQEHKAHNPTPDIQILIDTMLYFCFIKFQYSECCRKMLGRKPEEERTTDLDNSGANQSASLTSGSANTNNQNVESNRTNDNQYNMHMNENTTFIKGLKQKTYQTNNSKGVDIHKTRFAGSESYALAHPTSLGENQQTLKTELVDIYCQSEEGTYDVSGCNRHKKADGNIYSHTVDDVYDSTTHKRNDEEQEDKYDHFIGQKTEDLYDISMQS
ncbi:unnamed protein product [Mytilus edulis]|uniref:MAM domain-containing protein n=1 Tax=Mytilus edulis TaxID=6550 RepID=A0A8S3U8A6_MYTED|nr:unnamed protein product [Mytilus edulis]